MAKVIENLRGKIKAYLKERDYKKWCKKDEWNGLIPGDVVGYKGEEYMYMGINSNGGPGMPGMPEPIFWYADPRKNGVVYLRPPSMMHRTEQEIFSENNDPIQAGGVESITDLTTGKTVPGDGRVGYISFLNTGGNGLKKLRHISPQQWDQMIADAKAELAGQTVQ